MMAKARFVTIIIIIINQSLSSTTIQRPPWSFMYMSVSLRSLQSAGLPFSYRRHRWASDPRLSQFIDSSEAWLTCPALFQLLYSVGEVCYFRSSLLLFFIFKFNTLTSFVTLSILLALDFFHFFLAFKNLLDNSLHPYEIWLDNPSWVLADIRIFFVYP